MLERFAIKVCDDVWEKRKKKLEKWRRVTFYCVRNSLARKREGRKEQEYTDTYFQTVKNDIAWLSYNV